MALLGFERRWLLVVFDTVAPSGTHPRMVLGARDVPMDRFVTDLVSRAPFQFRLGLRLCLWITVLAPLFLLGRFSTFPGLSPADRVALLSRMGQSPLYLVREMPLLFKTVACLGLCGLPEVQRGVGITIVDRTPPDWAAGGGRR